MLSQTATYALRAVIHLAGEVGHGPVRVEDVADALSVPRNYLSKILHVLAREGVLTSTRGPGGGFSLVRPAAEIPIGEIVAEFDPPDEMVGCLLGRAGCDPAAPCPAHSAWKGLAAELTGFFENTTVADLAAPRQGAPSDTTRKGAPAPDPHPVPHPPQPQPQRTTKGAKP